MTENAHPQPLASQGSKIVMTLLVRNEEDIIEDNILFHYHQGVSSFVVMDNRSVDNTAKIIENLSDRIEIHYIYQDEDTYSQSEWVTQMARFAYSGLNADWVINNDADEFWVTERENLRDTLSDSHSDIDVIMVERYNAVLQDQEDIFKKTICHPRTSYIFERDSMNNLGRPLPPKCIHRGSKDVVVRQGNHQIDMLLGEQKPSISIRILHFPYRSFESYCRKIRFGGAAYEKNLRLDKRVGDSWRMHYQILETQAIVDFWAQLFKNQDEIEKSISKGSCFEDNTLIRFFREGG